MPEMNRAEVMAIAAKKVGVKIAFTRKPAGIKVRDRKIEGRKRV